MLSIKDILEAIKEKLSSPQMSKQFTTSIAASGTISDAVDLADSYAYLQVEIPTITSAQLELQVASSKDGTYRDFGQDVTTVAGTGAFNDTWDLGGWRYIKIKSSAAQTSVVTFFVRGVTY